MHTAEVVVVSLDDDAAKTLGAAVEESTTTVPASQDPSRKRFLSPFWRRVR